MGEEKVEWRKAPAVRKNQINGIQHLLSGNISLGRRKERVSHLRTGEEMQSTDKILGRGWPWGGEWRFSASIPEPRAVRGCCCRCWHSATRPPFIGSTRSSLGLCLCFTKSIMQMHKNKGEAWPCLFEMTMRLSLPFMSTKVYLLPLFWVFFGFFFNSNGFQSAFHTYRKDNFLIDELSVLIDEISIVNIVEIPFMSNKKRRAHL